uniref:Uncharacterized protein n=1 Tax=Populus trichocarpa TaxID=3694 RepID=U5GBP4_POPTR
MPTKFQQGRPCIFNSKTPSHYKWNHFVEIQSSFSQSFPNRNMDTHRKCIKYSLQVSLPENTSTYCEFNFKFPSL